MKPRPEDKITLHFRTTLLDGSEFDNTYARGKPVTGRVDAAPPPG